MRTYKLVMITRTVLLASLLTACSSTPYLDSRFGEAVDDPYTHHTEAMLIASVLRLPTVNGISTFNPPGWPSGWPVPSAPGLALVAFKYSVSNCSSRFDGMSMMWVMPTSPMK